MRLVIKRDGDLSLTCPTSYKEEKIEAFVRKHIDWLRKNVNEALRKQELTPSQYVDGEKILILGKLHYIKSLYGKDGCQIDGENFVITTLNNTLERKVKVVKLWQERELQKILSYLVPKWIEITNLTPSGWKIKDLKSCWGKCNCQNKNLTFSLRLITLPVECIEYVVLHELAHLKVSKHNSAFKQILTSYMPDWRGRTKQIKSL